MGFFTWESQHPEWKKSVSQKIQSHVKTLQQDLKSDMSVTLLNEKRRAEDQMIWNERVWVKEPCRTFSPSMLQRGTHRVLMPHEA